MENNYKNIKFSVLMSVYYKENPEYLDKSLESIFNQTIFPNEVILIEDGKLTIELDKVVYKYLKKYKNVFKVFKYDENRGLGFALHDGILKCSNEIVFRMDSDDISVNDRFEKQLKIFARKNVDVVGSSILEYDELMKKRYSLRTVPETDFEIKKMIKKRNPMNHMAVAYKKSSVLNAGNYHNMLYFEDYYLWARMIKNSCKFYNIQDVLVNVRGGNDMIKRRGGIKYIKPIIKFQTELYKIGIVNLADCLINIIIRVIISIIPNKLRLVMYNIFLREKSV